MSAVEYCGHGWANDTNRVQKINKPNTEGELIYKGQNVSLGYASCIADLKKGDELIKKYKINQVYNFAAILSAKGEINPAKTWDLNNAGFFNIVDICLKNKINKIFWPSSIAVFGKNSNLNFASIDEPMCPENN